MTVTVEQLQQYVGTKETGDFMQATLDSAKLLVMQYVGSSAVPPTIMDTAVLNVAWSCTTAAAPLMALQQFADFQGNAIRVARDPMTSTYPLLTPFVKAAV